MTQRVIRNPLPAADSASVSAFFWLNHSFQSDSAAVLSCFFLELLTEECSHLWDILQPLDVVVLHTLHAHQNKPTPCRHVSTVRRLVLSIQSGVMRPDGDASVDRRVL